MSTLPSTVTPATNAALEFSAQSQLNHSDAATEANATVQKRKRTKSPGIRVVGSRIYDSSNGISCHQCRQKTRDLAAACNNERKGKPCPIKYCQTCLKNRYGEEAEEVVLLGDWKCPKCRNSCNCSCCMKRQGQKPTGQLAKQAKALGFKSVFEMLRVQDSESLGLDHDTTINGAENSIVGKELVVAQKTKREGLKEISNANGTDDASINKRPIIANDDISAEQDGPGKVHGNNDILRSSGPEDWAASDFFLDSETWASHDDAFFKPVQAEEAEGASLDDAFFKPTQEEIYENLWKETAVIVGDDDITAAVKSQTGVSKATKVRTVRCETESLKFEEPLSPGTLLTEIWDIEFSPEDVGKVFQFLEFCRCFGEVLDVKEGEAEVILRELVTLHTSWQGENTLVVQFHIRVLNLILIDSGTSLPSLTTSGVKNSWLKALEDLITGSELLLEGFPLNWLEEGVGGYHDLDVSKKLSLLVFLCDQALCTEKFRSYIDDANLIFAGEKKEAKSNNAAAKEKEKKLKQKLKDKVAEAIINNGAPLSIAEHEALVSNIKKEVAQAHAEVLEAKGAIPKGKRNCDAMRTEPVFVDSTGQAFWKLKSYAGEYAFLLQEIKMDDPTAATADERWFFYDPEKKDEIEKYISSRAGKSKSSKVTPLLSNGSSEANM